MSESIRILGIDPGLNHTGFGVIDARGDKLTLVSAGCVNVPPGPLAERLAVIHRGLDEVIGETRPDVAAAEIIFLNVNPRSTLLLGQARGAALACAALHGLTVREFSATNIKQTVVGHGRAAKAQIQMMVKELLGITDRLQPDAADALACAVACAHSLRLAALVKEGALRGASAARSPRKHRSSRAAWTRLSEQRLEQNK